MNQTQKMKTSLENLPTILIIFSINDIKTWSLKLEIKPYQ